MRRRALRLADALEIIRQGAVSGGVGRPVPQRAVEPLDSLLVRSGAEQDIANLGPKCGVVGRFVDVLLNDLTNALAIRLQHPQPLFRALSFLILTLLPQAPRQRVLGVNVAGVYRQRRRTRLIPSSLSLHVASPCERCKFILLALHRFHGAVAKLVNDTLSQRYLPFWRETGKRDYFDGCIRDELQCRRAYGYVLDRVHCVTATLDLRYRRPVPLGAGPLRIEAWRDRPEPRRRQRVHGRLVLPDGEVAVEATGIFVQGRVSGT